MSECVVRMEMPESCKKCISTNCIWGKNGSDYLDVIAALQDFRRENNAGFPDFCPILCQLPDGHGRLVDADAVEIIIRKWFEEIKLNPDILLDGVKSLPTIVPAGAERSEKDGR